MPMGDLKMNNKSMWMRTAVLGAAAVCCCGGAVAQKSMCGPGMAGIAAPSGTPAADKMFLMKSAEGSMAEITFSKIALKKSKNDEVKMFAQKMIDDHTMLIANMKPFADQMGVMPPEKLNKVHMQEEARLSSMSGDKFDHEYITAMVGDHHKDLGEFMSEQATTMNPDLKTTVASGTQVIKDHTMMIDQLATKNGISTPPMPSSAM